MSAEADAGAISARPGLRTLAAVFVRLSLTAFGGPAAHIALMEDELVNRRRWLPRHELLDLVSAANLIPGPNSTEVAMGIGYRCAGVAGLVVAGTAFIAPAALVTAALAWAYARFGSSPRALGVLAGVEPVVVAVVVQALIRLARSAITATATGLLALGALAASALGVHELAVLAAAAALAVLIRRPHAAPLALVAPLPLGVADWGGALARAPARVGTLFLLFLKTGSVLYGSGYVLLAFLRADFVTRLGWLSEAQLLDAVAAGQVTPGPVFSTATFIGYLLGGAGGAAAATIAIFLPAFVFVALTAPFLPRLRRSPTVAAALDGLNAASLALMVWVTLQLGRHALVSPARAALALVASLLLWRRINSAYLVLGGAALGLLFGQFL